MRKKKGGLRGDKYMPPAPGGENSCLVQSDNVIQGESKKKNNKGYV